MKNKVQTEKHASHDYHAPILIMSYLSHMALHSFYDIFPSLKANKTHILRAFYQKIIAFIQKRISRPI
ncbi:hypothetical protein Syun_014612 [Stephania yunnanensis]|uniref:Uncharacterized protein n=1 Tax=Stephania yunnanensis TaxID=152371 RepID=A0AAP0JJW2_9MAGN